MKTLEKVRSGYKHTEVGEIPEDWDLKSANELCDLVVDCKNRTPPIVEGGEFAVVRTPNVRGGRFKFEDLNFTDAASYKIWTARAVPQVGDVLITREAPLGEVCLVPEGIQLCLGQRMMMYRPDTTKVLSNYLLHSLLSKPVQKNLRDKIGGSTVGHAKVDDIRFLKLPIPPTIHEQQAIAEALDDADARIAALEALIAKQRDLKQATMQQLLTGKTRLPGFSGNWEVKRLGELLAIRHGKSQRGVEASNGAYPIFATGGTIGRASTPIYDKPSVLIGRKGTINRPQFSDKPFWSVDTLFYSEMLNRSVAKFLYYRFWLIDWNKYNEASGVPSLNAKTIENIEILVCQPEEQAAIAKTLTDMDEEIAALEAEVEKARTIKQGMMQTLLTGKVRLV